MGLSLPLFLLTGWEPLIVFASVNFVLGFFNLIPAYPLDGGRVLRAVLELSGVDDVKATKLVATIGQGFSFLLFVSGLVLGNWSFVVVAALILFLSSTEKNQVT
jgi:Zn-dependent protease